MSPGDQEEWEPGGAPLGLTKKNVNESRIPELGGKRVLTQERPQTFGK